jgi:NAD(P)-dependent dehydrogenase (short-subunit alcohol dehydrogenase family)
MGVARVSRDGVEAIGGLGGRVALVTGASSGIGRAITLELARQGAELYVVGRDQARLDGTVAAAQEFSEVRGFRIDLTVGASLEPLLRHLERDARLDILIHSAGVMYCDPVERASIEEFDRQYDTNVRAPYMLTQHLLPLLTAARGQIVFMNSSAGLTAKRPELGQYSATKHALRAIADSLREEVNPRGIRVLTVYLGRTATPMQEGRYRQEGRIYHPETLLQPEDVASMVVGALMLPDTAEVTDISMRPKRKTY